MTGYNSSIYITYMYLYLTLILIYLYSKLSFVGPYCPSSSLAGLFLPSAAPAPHDSSVTHCALGSQRLCLKVRCPQFLTPYLFGVPFLQNYFGRVGSNLIN